MAQNQNAGREAPERSDGGANPASKDHVFDPRALEGGLDVSPGQGSGIPERIAEVGLRPPTLAEFVGQTAIVENLSVHLEAAMGRNEPPDHVLFCGPPGLGKTSLARILAEELGTELHATSGPALDKPRDLLGLLTNLKRGDVFFIDEIHRIPISVEEYLYTAMEDFRVEMTLDSGPHARVLPITIEPFMLVGATTREGLLSAPFRARFGLVQRLDPYPVRDLVKIIVRAAKILGVGVEPTAAQTLAERSRGTPRIASRFLKRARDRAQVGGFDLITDALARETLERIGVDERGLEEMDRRILGCLADHAPKPVALKTIAAVVGETEDTIEDVFEPHLLRSGFLLKTPRGRAITGAGLGAIDRDLSLLDDLGVRGPDGEATGSKDGTLFGDA